MTWTRWRVHFERQRTRPLPPTSPPQDLSGEAQPNIEAPVAAVAT